MTSGLASIPQYCSQVVQSVTQHAAFKFIAGSLLAAYSFTFGDGASTVLEAISLLIFLDFVTAILKAKLGGEVIESWKVFRSAVKFTVYLTMLAACHLFQVVVPVLGSYATDIMAAFLAVTELISILENVGKMGFHIPLRLLNALQDNQNQK